MSTLAKHHQLLMKARSLSYLQGEDAYDQAETYINDAFRELEKVQKGGLSRIDRLVQTEMLHHAMTTLVDGSWNYISPAWRKRELSAMEMDLMSNECLDQHIMYPTLYAYEDYFQKPPTRKPKWGHYYPSFERHQGVLAVGVTQAMIVTRELRIADRFRHLMMGIKLESRSNDDLREELCSVSMTYNEVMHTKYMTNGAYPMIDWQKPRR